mgnify:CR=1 FL=1
MPSWRYLKHIQQAQTFRGDINGIKDRKQNQRMHFTSRHYLLLSAGKADGDSQKPIRYSVSEPPVLMRNIRQGIFYMKK